MNSHKSSRENWKRFKNCSYFCQTRVFRDWNESPKSRQIKPPKHSRTKSWKNFSKCFSRLEGLPARESRAEPRKSLSNPCDWTFHSRTSCQKWPAKTRLSLATWLTRDWVAKTGQNWVSWKISDYLTKYFPKTPKTLKNLFALELTKIEHVKTHFIKYNHTNEYGIYWT